MRYTPQILALFLAFSSFLHSQNVKLEWVKSLDPSFASVMVEDQMSNVYITGAFADSIDLDPGPGVFMKTSKGVADIYVVKLNSKGEFIWGIVIGDSNDEEVKSISIDASGQIIVAGTFSNIVDFNPGTANYYLTSLNGKATFALSLSPSGTMNWAKAYKGAGDVSLIQMHVDPSGNLILLGDFNQTIELLTTSGPDTLRSAGGFSDVFVLKLDFQGNVKYGKAILSNANLCISHSLTTDNLGNFILIGEYKGTIDFDPNTGVVSRTSVGTHYNDFVLKLDSSGSFIWVKTINDHFCLPNSVKTDSYDNIYVIGAYSGMVDIDPGPGIFAINTPTLTTNSFILKLDKNGVFLSAAPINCDFHITALDFQFDKENHIYLSGCYKGTADLDPGPDSAIYASPSSYSQFLLKIDSLLDMTWVISWPAGQVVRQYLYLGHSNTIYMRSNFQGPIDFDPDTSQYIINKPFGDYTMKLHECVIDSSFRNVTACQSYTWPFNSKTYTASGTYRDTGISAFGCDSIATINLSLISINTGINRYFNQLTAVQNGASYQWLDCDNNYSSISGAVNQTFVPQKNGNYAVRILLDGCFLISDCEQIIAAGIDSDSKSTSTMVYPNPSKGLVHVSLESEFAKTVLNLYSVDGRKVRSFQPTSSSFKFELPSQNGIYILEVINNTSMELIKVVRY